MIQPPCLLYELIYFYVLSLSSMACLCFHVKQFDFRELSRSFWNKFVKVVDSSSPRVSPEFTTPNRNKIINYDGSPYSGEYIITKVPFLSPHPLKLIWLVFLFFFAYFPFLFFHPFFLFFFPFSFLFFLFPPFFPLRRLLILISLTWADFFQK